MKRLAIFRGTVFDVLDGEPSVPLFSIPKASRRPASQLVELLALAYPSTEDPRGGSKEVLQEQARRAQNAYRLLRSWQNVPGSLDGRTVDERRCAIE